MLLYGYIGVTVRDVYGVQGILGFSVGCDGCIRTNTSKPQVPKPQLS